MNDPPAQVAFNLDRIRQRIAAAAARAGRRAEEVTLIAVTKYVDVELTRALVLAGCHDLGESRPQELWSKSEALRDVAAPLRWHLIGHLQRNKVRRTLPLVHLLHSTDSWRLLTELQSAAAASDVECRTLLEINVSGDEAKHGMTAAQLQELLPRLSQLPNVRVSGLMTMAALDRPGEAARADFRALRNLRERLQSSCPSGVELRELSMGMSGDFETAIEEGATMVRVGSALFEGCRSQ